MSGYLSTTLGDFGHLDVGGAVNLPLSDEVAIRLKAASLRQDGYVERLDDGGALGAEDAVYGSVQLRWQPSDRLDLNVSVDYSKRDTDLGPHKVIDYYRYNGAPDVSPPLLSPGAAGSAAWNLQWGASPLLYAAQIPTSLYEVAGTGIQPRLESEGVGFSLNLLYNINESMAFRSITGVRDVEDFRRSDMDDVAAAYLVLDVSAREGVDFWSQEFQLSGAGDKANWWLACTSHRRSRS